MAEGASLGLESYFDRDHVANGRRGEGCVVRELADSWRWAEGGVMAVFVYRQKGGIDI